MGKELPPRKYLLGARCRVECVLWSIYFVLRFMSLPHFQFWETSCLLPLPYKMGLAWPRGWGPGLGAVALTQRQAGLRAPARGCVRGDQGTALEAAGPGLELLHAFLAVRSGAVQSLSLYDDAPDCVVIWGQEFSV